MRRLPKRGFSNYGFRKEVQIINLDKLAILDTDIINPEVLHKLGIIKKINTPIKILGTGIIDKSLEIAADMFSKSAIEKIEKAGGKAIYL